LESPRRENPTPGAFITTTTQQKKRIIVMLRKCENRENTLTTLKASKELSIFFMHIYTAIAIASVERRTKAKVL